MAESEPGQERQEQNDDPEWMRQVVLKGLVAKIKELVDLGASSVTIQDVLADRRTLLGMVLGDDAATGGGSGPEQQSLLLENGSDKE